MSNCFTEIYRGCFDGWTSSAVQSDYSGCRRQFYLGRVVQWCFCNKKLCNGYNKHLFFFCVYNFCGELNCLHRKDAYIYIYIYTSHPLLLQSLRVWNRISWCGAGGTLNSSSTRHVWVEHWWWRLARCSASHQTSDGTHTDSVGYFARDRCQFCKSGLRRCKKNIHFPSLPHIARERLDGSSMRKWTFCFQMFLAVAQLLECVADKGMVWTLTQLFFFRSVLFILSWSQQPACRSVTFRFPLLPGVYSDPFDCARFVHCFSGFTYRRQCPEGLSRISHSVPLTLNFTTETCLTLHFFCNKKKTRLILLSGCLTGTTWNSKRKNCDYFYKEGNNCAQQGYKSASITDDLFWNILSSFFAAKRK